MDERMRTQMAYNEWVNDMMQERAAAETRWKAVRKADGTWDTMRLIAVDVIRQYPDLFAKTTPEAVATALFTLVEGGR